MTVKRSAGQGSLFRRKSDGRWVAAISTGPRGKRTTMARYARTRREAAEHLDELRRLVLAPGSGRTTVGAYLRSWLDVAGKRSLKASTWRTYDVALRLHIDPAIGHVTLSRLLPEHVDQMLAMSDLAPKGQRNVLGFLGRVLDVALARGLVVRNAARLVEPPRIFREEPTALTATDAKRLLTAVRGDRLEALWVLAIATGMRQAELLGLRWADVLLEETTRRGAEPRQGTGSPRDDSSGPSTGDSPAPDFVMGTRAVSDQRQSSANAAQSEGGVDGRAVPTVTVRYALARVNGEYVLEEPKTPRSRRTVGLPSWAVTALREHRTRQVAERLAAGRPTDDGLVFVSPEGRPLNGGWVSHRWRVVSRAAGVDVHFHGLRHFQATILRERDVPEDVRMARMGHSTRETQRHYGREAPDRAAVVALEEALG